MTNIMDDCSRECVAIEVGQLIPAERAVRVLERLSSERGLPDILVMENGREFTSRTLAQWAFTRGVERHFIQPGTPVENAFFEGFNVNCRDERRSPSWVSAQRHATTLPHERELHNDPIRRPTGAALTLRVVHDVGILDRQSDIVRYPLARAQEKPLLGNEPNPS